VADVENPDDDTSPLQEQTTSIYVWHFVILQVRLNLRKAEPRMLFASFVTKAWDSVCWEPQHTFWTWFGGILSWSEEKQEFKHGMHSRTKHNASLARRFQTCPELGLKAIVKVMCVKDESMSGKNGNNRFNFLLLPSNFSRKSAEPPFMASQKAPTNWMWRYI
jgi:hypothetical protein